MLRSPAIATLLLLLLTSSAFSQEEAAKSGSPAEAPEPKSVVTRHELRIGGQTVRYAATAGWLIMKGTEGEPVARFGYTAYTREGVADPSRRPVLFAFNGGPGSSSIWLHMGILGPRRVVVTDADFTPPPPVEIVDNAYTVLDVSDVVMIDPVGTGYSKVLGKAKVEDFWGVDQDIASVAAFIARWVGENGRWRSPKYVLGESYGGIRASGLAYALQTTHRLNLNGIVLVSPFMDFGAGVDGIGNDLPHALYLPALAATAWYHHALEDRPENLRDFLEEVERFAIDDYVPALLRGYTLAEQDARAIAARLAAYTGTSADYWMRADLRVSHERFLQELAREERIVAGRIDSRFAGGSLNPLAERQDYDPFFPSVGPAFAAAFFDYYRRELGFEHEDEYVVSAGAFQKWDWKHRQPGAGFWSTPAPNVLPDLAHAMTMNPGLHVLVQQGYYDLATPYFVTEYYVDHLDVPPAARARIHFELYEAGHMMYIHPPSMEKYRDDLVRFIRETDRVD
ncbi:MAG TPA: carboxypeptidase [Thermoanaerobaculia bacterium]|nr:carboxypeptidase [Thermoanaerobaculia bacterium]